jgi:prepilin-type N-terminal cleavage/methylation domain-containing protein
MNNQKAFTLVECMTCMVVLSILTLIAGPSLRVLKKRTVFRHEVIQLVNSLQKAKVMAIKNNSFVVLKVTETGYTIFVDDGSLGGLSGDWEKQDGEKALASHFLPDSINLTTTFTLNRTRFNGRIGNKAGRVILTDSMGKRTEIVMSITGRIRVQKT